MNLPFRQLGPSELLPRYIFAESLIARRRVLEVGAVAATRGRSAQFLGQRGARSVLACDSDLAAVEEAQKELGGPQLRFRTNVFDDLAAGEFELVLVADLAPYVRAPELLKELVRLIPAHGHLIGGLRNPAGLALCQLMEPEGPEAPPTFGQLLDALSPHFPSVEVATQSAVLGYQLAFEGAEGLSVDGTLVDQVESAYFVVIAGQERARTLDPSWVQLPPEPLAFAGERLERTAQRAKEADERTNRLKKLLDEAREETEQRSAHAARLERELEEEREHASQLQARLESIERSASDWAERDGLAVRLKHAEADLAVAHQRVEEAERRAGAYQSEIEDLQGAALRVKEQHLVLQETIRQERARREEAAAAQQQAQERATKAVEHMEELAASNASLRVEAEKSQILVARAREERDGLERELTEARHASAAKAAQLSAAYAAEENVHDELGRAQTRLSQLAAISQSEEHYRRLSAELEQKLVEARTQVELREELESELVSLKSAKRDLEGELAQAHAELKRHESEREDLSRQLDGAKQRMEDLTTELVAEGSDKQARRQEVDKALEALRAAEAECAHASARVKELENKAQILTRDASDRAYRLQTENEQLTRQLAEQQRAAQEALALVTTEEGKLRSTLDRAQTERGKLEKRLQALVVERGRLNERVESAEIERAQLSEQLESAKAEGARLSDQLQAVSGAGAREAELTAALADRDAKLQILQRRLAAQSAELSALRNSVGRAVPQQVEQIYQRASAELSAMKAEIRRSASSPGPTPLEDPTEKTKKP